MSIESHSPGSMESSELSRSGQLAKAEVAKDALETTLREAGMKLARAVSALEPDERYHPTTPTVMAVGGFVRDMVAGLHPKDMDVEVYGVEPARLKELLGQLFGRVDSVGEAFGILKVRVGEGLEMDVSIPRRDSKAGAGHKGLVDSDPSLDVREAALRRDFTMNAMVYDLLTGSIFDPFGGLEDLKKRELRVTDPERFQDDPLRVMRAAQFAARFELVVEPKSFQLMKEMVERGALDELSRERISEEWKKMMMKADRPSVGLELLRSLGAVERHFPELHALIDTPQEPEWHPEGDVWTHTRMVIDQAAKVIRRGDFLPVEKEIVMFGALCHDFGKPSTTEVTGGRIRSLAHEEAGREPTKQFLRRLSLGGEVEDGVVACVVEHFKPGALHAEFEKGRTDEKNYANAVRRLLKRIAPVSWKVLVGVSEADSRGRALPGVETNPYGPGELMAKTVAEFGLDAAPTAPLVMGRDVLALVASRGDKRKPGEWVGKAIRTIEEMRDAGSVTTREEGLAALARLEL